MADAATGRERFSDLRRSLPEQLPAYLGRQRWFVGLRLDPYRRQRDAKCEPEKRMVHFHFVLDGRGSYRPKQDSSYHSAISASALMLACENRAR